MILSGLGIGDLLGGAREEHHRRAGGYGFARAREPFGVGDLRFLGEVDLFAANVVAQDFSIDDGHEMSAELAHQREAGIVRVRKLHEKRDGVFTRESGADGILSACLVLDGCGLAPLRQRRFPAEF